MLGPVQNRNTDLNLVQTLDRVDLSLSGSQIETELSSAVGSVVSSQELDSDKPQKINHFAERISKIKSEYQSIEQNNNKIKELEIIRNRILKGRNNVELISDGNIKDALNSASKATLVFNSTSNNSKDATKTLADKNLRNAVVGQNYYDADNVGVDDQKAVILRINEALSALSSIIDKISNDTSNSSDRIISLTGSVAGLNSAKSTVDNTRLSLNLATNAVDMIMTNIKTAVLSHSNIDTGIVRLVLT